MGIVTDIKAVVVSNTNKNKEVSNKHSQ